MRIIFSRRPGQIGSLAWGATTVASRQLYTGSSWGVSQPPRRGADSCLNDVPLRDWVR